MRPIAFSGIGKNHKTGRTIPFKVPLCMSESGVEQFRQTVEVAQLDSFSPLVDLKKKHSTLALPRFRMYLNFLVQTHWSNNPDSFANRVRAEMVSAQRKAEELRSKKRLSVRDAILVAFQDQFEADRLAAEADGTAERLTRRFVARRFSQDPEDTVTQYLTKNGVTPEDPKYGEILARVLLRGKEIRECSASIEQVIDDVCADVGRNTPIIPIK